MVDFMKIYEQLNSTYQHIIQQLMIETMKPIKLKPDFYRYFPYCLKEKNMKLSEVARELEKKYGVDAEQSLRKAISNRYRKCSYSKSIAEIMGISEDMLLYGAEEGVSELAKDVMKNRERDGIKPKDNLAVQKAVLLSKTLYNVKQEYEHLDKKLKSAVLNLAINLWYYQYAPEYWDTEGSEYLEEEIEGLEEEEEIGGLEEGNK